MGFLSTWQSPVSLPSQHTHREWWSILCCHCWKPGSRKSQSHSWNDSMGESCWVWVGVEMRYILQVRVPHSVRESRPWVMTPVNSVSLRASISNQWIVSSEFAHHAPPLMLSSSSDPWKQQTPECILPNCLAPLLFGWTFVYLHVEARPLRRETILRHRGRWKLVGLNLMGLHPQRRTF